MLLSAFFYSLQNFDVKILIHHYPIWTITFFRGLVSFLLSMFMILMLNIRPLLGIKRTKLIVRGCYGSLSIVLGFLSLNYISLSLATILLSTSSVWMSIIGTYFLKDEWHYINNIGVGITFVGIILISAYKHKENDFIGIFLAILASIFNAAANITIRDIRDESTLTISLYAMGICMIICTPGILLERPHIFHNDVIILIQLFFTGIFSFLAQTLKTSSLQLSKNLGIILLRYFDIFFSFIWDILYFKVKFSLIQIIGMTIVIIGCLIRKY